jgi:stress response protein YsnF
MTYEKIVTLYDTADHAEAAKRSLESAGISSGEISMINSKMLALAGDKLREPGLWHRLFNRDIEQHEATVYARAVEAGGVVLTVRVAEGDVARATGILNAHRAVDMAKRTEQERLNATASAPKPAIVRTAPAMAAAGAMAGEEILALAEEQISVGKRVIKEGTTRIRRFVTESPVEAQVTLHEEHTRILRRASTDPAFLRDLDWGDKTIEITETIEEPVVTKSVHIAEEVVIQREGSDHVKTLRDKVRRQQIEVERIAGTEPAAKAGTEPAAKASAEPAAKG